MTKQKYIGIENELISFHNNREVPFNNTRLKQLVKNTKYYETKRFNYIWSEIGNLYYIDTDEIEIATPPIPLNKGFATRVTNSLIIGRNQIIKNTPHMKHTGYSMHWNLTRPENSHTKVYAEGIAIPFQLFGLTPTSCGFNIKQKTGGKRFEIAGDSLTNEDQIQATALLLGAYNMASEKYCFPTIIPTLKNKLKEASSTDHMLRFGRNTMINTYKNFPITNYQSQNPIENTSQKKTSVQNILELFYEWLSPFVYKLGEREEINNLEAFIKGEKRLEIDDIKYFYMLEKKGEEFFNEYNGENGHGYNSKVYRPVNIQTQHGKRSPVLKLNNKVKISLEGQLWQKSMNTAGFKIINRTLDWNTIETKINNKSQNTHSLDEAYVLLESVSQIKHRGSVDCSNIEPNTITQKQYTKMLNKQIVFDANKDDSAIIVSKDAPEFNNYIKCIKKVYGHIY